MLQFFGEKVHRKDVDLIVSIPEFTNLLCSTLEKKYFAVH